MRLLSQTGSSSRQLSCSSQQIVARHSFERHPDSSPDGPAITQHPVSLLNHLLSKTTRDQRPWRLHHVHVLCGLSPDSSLPATLLVNTGAETDFISSSFCQRAAIPIHRMLNSQTVSLAINNTLVLDSEANVTFFLPSSPKVTITRSFLVAPISPDIILGTPFLHDYNPKIDFITGNIEFRLSKF